MNCDVSLKSLVFKRAVVVIIASHVEYGASLKVIMPAFLDTLQI